MTLDGPRRDLDALFDLVRAHVPAPAQLGRGASRSGCSPPCSPYDRFLGRILTGRIEAGNVVAGETLKALARGGERIETGRVSRILAFRGLASVPIEAAEAGDIVAIAGLTKATVADTLCAIEVDTPMPAQPIDPPTLSMTFRHQRQPAGRARRRQGAEPRDPRPAACARPRATSPSASPRRPGGEAFEVAGRGELQLGVLIENMRREGFELSIGRPRVSIDRRRRRRAAGADRGGDDRRRRRATPASVVEKLSARARAR